MHNRDLFRINIIPDAMTFGVQRTIMSFPGVYILHTIGVPYLHPTKTSIHLELLKHMQLALPIKEKWQYFTLQRDHYIPAN